MSDVSLQFDDHVLLRAVERAAERGVRAAAKVLRERCRQAVGTPYPPASQPGDPPRRRSGAGRESIVAVAEPGGLAARVGARGHLALLEFGTRRVARRPWLVSTLLAQREELAGAASEAMRDELT